MHNKTKIKGSLSIEYAVLISIVVLALLAVQIYVRRALCGKYKEVGDTYGYGLQYEPGVTEIPSICLECRGLTGAGSVPLPDECCDSRPDPATGCGSWAAIECFEWQ